MLNTITVHTGTWNLNGKVCNEDLTPWLIPAGGEKPDIYVLGFQEFDLSRESFVRVDEERLNKWLKLILDTISPLGKYSLVGRQQLVGMLIIIFSKDELIPYITDLDSDMVGTGYGGIIGNKGGVGVRFRIGNETFCFVNSHLNAHVQNFERRNLDFKSICSRMLFTPSQSSGTNKPQPSTELPEDFVISDDKGDELNVEVPPIEEKEKKEGELTIFDHNYLVWLGDLNYRIELTRDNIISLIEEKKWQDLCEADQLIRQIQKGNAFEDFVEGNIAFLPTYKFDPGTDTYDSSKKKRLPAYCDRVLWKKSTSVTLLSYNGHMELKCSDHKPVSAYFHFKLSSNSLPNLHPSESLKASLTNEKVGFPQKSYLYTTASRFARSASRSVGTYVTLAVFVGVVAYMLTRR